MIEYTKIIPAHGLPYHTSGIYVIKVLTESGMKRYVGQSLDIRNRVIRHFRKLESNTHVNAHLLNAFNRYGLSSFSCEILEVVFVSEGLLSKEDKKSISKESLTNLENFYIESLKVTDSKHGFNKIRGQHSSAGIVGSSKTHSEETKAKIRFSKLGDKNPMFGKTITDRHRENLKACRQGEKHPRFGVEVSDDTKAKMRLAKPRTEVYKIDLKTKERTYYDCLRSANKDGYGRSSIRKVLDTGKTFKGFLWESVKEASQGLPV